MEKASWIAEVFRVAKSYGYTGDQILIFQGELLDCFKEGLTPEECVSKVF